MPVPDGWITTPALLSQLGAAGYPTTDRQLERWRADGLLPASRQLSNYRGSETWHPPRSVEQIIAIHRIKSADRRISVIGPVLWAAGYEVADQHWREHLQKADRLGSRMGRLLSYLIDRADRSEANATLGEQFAEHKAQAGVHASIRRRLDDKELAAFANTMFELASSQFSAFEYVPPGSGGLDTKQVILKGLALEQAQTDQIHGKRFTFEASLSGTLKDLGNSISEVGFGEFSQSEIESARDDLRNGMKIAICHYEAMKWIYGNAAFGLRIFRKIVQFSGMQFLFHATLCIARLRRTSKNMLNSELISELAKKAEATYLMSEYFCLAQTSHPHLRDLVGAEKFKIRFSEIGPQEKDRESLERAEFPTPNFRPWQSWRRLSGDKIKMPIGLVVLGASSPDSISLAEVLSQVSGETQYPAN